MAVLPTTGQVHAAVEKYFGKELPAGVAVVIGAVTPSESHIFYCGNLLDFNNNPIDLGGRSHFQLASVTKTFIANLLAIYQVDNSSFWDSTINSYHPLEAPALPSTFDMTMLNVAQYVSGLPQDNERSNGTRPYFNPYPYTPISMYGFLSEAEINVEGAGTDYTYSNLGYTLLAHSIPQAVGETTLNRLLRDQILSMMEMNHTRWFGGVPYNEMPLAFVVDYSRSPPPTLTATGTCPGYLFDPAYNGSCGLVTTPNDMMTWLKGHMGLGNIYGPILNLMQTTLYQPIGQKFSTGIGWFLDDWGLGNVFYKDGWIDGACSLMYFNQSGNPGTIPSDAGLFLLTNGSPTGDYNPMYRTLNGLLRDMQGGPATEDIPSQITQGRFPRLREPLARVVQ